MDESNLCKCVVCSSVQQNSSNPHNPREKTWLLHLPCCDNYYCLDCLKNITTVMCPSCDSEIFHTLPLFILQRTKIKSY